jgi:hypothetical protein
MARPIKYKERLNVLSLALEPSLIEFLDEKSKELKISRNEYLTSLILSADKNLASSLIEEFKELKAIITKQALNISEYNKQLENLKNKSISRYYTDIEDIPEIKEFLAKNNERIKSVIRNIQYFEKVEKINSLSSALYNEFELFILENKGQMPKSKAIIINSIKKYILSFQKALNS